MFVFPVSLFIYVTSTVNKGVIFSKFNKNDLRLSIYYNMNPKTVKYWRFGAYSSQNINATSTFVFTNCCWRYVKNCRRKQIETRQI